MFLDVSFNMAFTPWLFEKLKLESGKINRKIVKITYVYFAAILTFSAAWAWISSIVLTLIADSSYLSAASNIFILCISYAFQGMHTMVVNYIYYKEKTGPYGILTIVTIVVNIILNIVFIKTSGSQGAAYAKLTVNIFVFITTWIMSSRVYRMPWSLKK
jgi:O-antigen/teichoic acid export membrane protein